nr:MAG TPA: hypothetical protein [Bacteriophage sp.]
MRPISMLNSWSGYIICFSNILPYRLLWYFR